MAPARFLYSNRFLPRRIDFSPPAASGLALKTLNFHSTTTGVLPRLLSTGIGDVGSSGGRYVSAFNSRMPVIQHFTFLLAFVVPTLRIAPLCMFVRYYAVLDDEHFDLAQLPDL